MSRSPWPGRKEEIEQMLAEGCSRRVIAAFYGVSKPTLRAACLRIGVTLPHVPFMKRVQPYYFLPKTPELKPAAPANLTSYTEDGRKITVCPAGYAAGAVDPDRYTVKPRGRRK